MLNFLLFCVAAASIVKSGTYWAVFRSMSLYNIWNDRVILACTILFFMYFIIGIGVFRYLIG